MKKIIILIVFFFNLLPYIEQGTLTFTGPTAVLADYDDDGEFNPYNDPTDIIPGENFDSFTGFLEDRGYEIGEPFETTLTINGVEYEGTMVSIFENGESNVGYFTPHEDSDIFQTGNYYAIGREDDPGGTDGPEGPIGPEDPEDPDGPGYGGGGGWNWEEPDENYDPYEDPFFYDDEYDDYYTGATPPVENPGPPPPGNKQPVAFPATPQSTANANKANTIYNGIKNNPNFIDMKAKSINPAANTYESGMSVTKNGTTYGSLNYVNGNSSTNVSVPTSDPNHTVVAGVHTHPPGTPQNRVMAAPSPKDIYHLIKGNKDNVNYTTDIVLAADGSEYAIVISDRTKALAFLTKYPESTTLNGNAWGGSYADNKSPYFIYSAYVSMLIKEGYSEDNANIFAMVYMMADLKYDMGIKLLKKDGDTFKQLDTNLYKDSSGKTRYGVKIFN